MKRATARRGRKKLTASQSKSLLPVINYGDSPQGLEGRPHSRHKEQLSGFLLDDRYCCDSCIQIKRLILAHTAHHSLKINLIQE